MDMTPGQAVTQAHVSIHQMIERVRRDREGQIPDIAARMLCADRHQCSAADMPCRQCRRDIDRAIAGQQAFDSVEEDRREFERRMP